MRREAAVFIALDPSSSSSPASPSLSFVHRYKTTAVEWVPDIQSCVPVWVCGSVCVCVCRRRFTGQDRSQDGAVEPVGTRGPLCPPLHLLLLLLVSLWNLLPADPEKGSRVTCERIQLKAIKHLADPSLLQEGRDCG